MPPTPWRRRRRRQGSCQNLGGVAADVIGPEHLHHPTSLDLLVLRLQFTGDQPRLEQDSL
jgi:hypothetical protein